MSLYPELPRLPGIARDEPGSPGLPAIAEATLDDPGVTNNTGVTVIT